MKPRNVLQLLLDAGFMAAVTTAALYLLDSQDILYVHSDSLPVIAVVVFLIDAIAHAPTYLRGPSDEGDA